MMKLSHLYCLLALVVGGFWGVSSSAQSGSLYDAVDPFIGTAGGGNTFPGASLPFGMIQWSPDTNEQGFYVHEQKSIYGFSLTHLSGVGCPIFADVPILPWTGAVETSPGKSRSAYTAEFEHGAEQAQPGYYSVTLANGVKVELTVDERSGIARFRFPDGKTAGLLVNAGGSADADVHMAFLPPAGREKDGSRIELTADGTLQGTVTSGGFCGSATRYTLYFAGKFDQPVRSVSTWQEDAMRKGERVAKGKKTGAWLEFGDRREVQMKVGISYVSEANALDNLNKEIAGWNFDAQHAKARKNWTEMLDRVWVEGGAPDQRKIFATGLYHSLMNPNLFSDENGEYTGFDWKLHSLAGTKQHAQYANFSDWDIYRNTVQLQTLLTGEREGDMMQSLVNDAEQSGWLPRWPAANQATYVMAGDSPSILLSSVYAFGAHNFDTAAALKYMVKGGTVPDRDLPLGSRYNQNTERPHLKEYLKYGYVPADDPISGSRTLEYANDDFAIAQLARAVGDQDVYKHFLKQSESWRNLLDPETHWIRPRHEDGSWLAGFDPERSMPRQSNSSVSTDQVGFEEGNTYQYTFMIPFDYPELFRRMGGDEQVKARLDKFFLKLRCWGDPCFNMENEPDFVTPYAYTFAGMPWKTQEVMARIERETFKTTPDGIAGNDDLGATSGVYVWNALGLYPAVPGVGGLALGAPMFRRATMHFADGRTLIVRGEGSGPYVQSVTLNGAPYASTWLPLSTLKGGTSELVFKLTGEPNLERGRAAGNRPPAFTE
jgi:predicted alpha-1,2-mannosidase